MTARIFTLALTSLLSCTGLLLLAWPVFAYSEDSYNDWDTGLLQEEIVQLESRGIFVGTECGESLFCPDEPALRKTIAVWLVRALEDDNPQLLEASRFDDVDAKGFWAKYIERLAELGITNGCGKGRFCPEGQISRAHLAVFLTRAYDLLEVAAGPGFADVDQDAWYLSAVHAVSAAGLIDRCQSETESFCPGEPVTRVELAVAIARAEKRLLAKYSPPDTPRDIYLVKNSNGGLWVKWRSPWNSGGTPIEKYLLQWHADDESFDISRQTEIGDIGQLSHTLENISSEAVYTIRVIAVNQAGPGNPSPAVKETDFNHALLEMSDLEIELLESMESVELSRLLRNRLWYYMENKMLPRYEEKHPWLRQAWTHYKQRVTFTTICVGSECLMPGNGYVSFDCRVSLDPDEQLPACRLSQLTLRRQQMYSDALIAHELGHVLTLANGVVEDSAPLAMAFLYFVNLSAGSDNCSAHELYADTLGLLVVRQSWTGYWHHCRRLPDRPTSEARRVVKEALAGEIPSWFVDHYMLADGWDYEAIWDDVNRLKGQYRQVTIYNLGDQFGGYCDVATVEDSTDGQPWKDGGCPSGE